MRGTMLAFVAIGVGVTGMIGVDAAVDRLTVEEMADAADSFLASLSDEQRAEATFEFDSDERERHHFIPPEAFPRNGVFLGDMTPAQREAAHALLAVSLSPRGQTTVAEVIESEGILRDLEGPDRQFRRDPEEYWISVFGEPGTSGSWGWRWEGHHVSLHFTVVEGQLTVSTPTFLASNPARVPSGPRMGLRALGAQEDAGRALLASLDPNQLEATIFDDVAPRDIVTGAAETIDPLDPVGVRAADLEPDQRDLLMALIDAYVGLMSDDIAGVRTQRIEEAGTGEIRFAWAGSTEPGELAYYRVQGPTFLIEYDNTQGDPNHIHTVFRDFEGDLGRDILREHLERDH